MKEKKLLKIQDALHEHLLAIYQYQSIYGEIPVFILKFVDFHQLFVVKNLFKGERFIILSQNDVIYGADVFPLKFLHIINHSTLFYGNDILKNIIIKKSDMLKAVELELRTKLIQLREDFLSDSFDVFLQNITNFLNVIGEALEYIDPTLKSGKNFADLYNQKKSDPLEVLSHINQSLQDLCDQIDTFKL